jgi:hypothetical protein
MAWTELAQNGYQCGALVNFRVLYEQEVAGLAKRLLASRAQLLLEVVATHEP